MDKKKSKQQDVLVIGAGASGMMTAITAARRGLSVTVLEHMDKPGKKILATGNGKCNFTNLKMSPRCYYGDHGLVQEILKQFTVEDTLAFFREIGIWPKEKNGYVYPNSGQASSVADALSAEMKRSGVSLVTSCDIRQLCETKYGFEDIHGNVLFPQSCFCNRSSCCTEIRKRWIHDFADKIVWAPV